MIIYYHIFKYTSVVRSSHSAACRPSCSPGVLSKTCSSRRTGGQGFPSSFGSGRWGLDGVCHLDPGNQHAEVTGEKLGIFHRTSIEFSIESQRKWWLTWGLTQEKWRFFTMTNHRFDGDLTKRKGDVTMKHDETWWLIAGITWDMMRIICKTSNFYDLTSWCHWNDGYDVIAELS